MTSKTVIPAGGWIWLLKSFPVFVMLTSYSALAQTRSGTSVIFNSAKDEIVVAADSRVVDDRTGISDDFHCKIAELRRQFIFTSVGHTSAYNDPNHTATWDNTNVARDAVQNATKNMTINDAYMDGVIDYWASVMKND